MNRSCNEFRQLGITVCCQRLFQLAILIAFLLPSPTWADTFPESGDFNGMQIEYSIDGFTVTGSEDVSDFTTTRTLTGYLTTSGTLTVSGTVTNSRNNLTVPWTGNTWTEATITVNAGDNSDSQSIEMKSFISAPFSVSVQVPAGTTSGSFSIQLAGNYGNGEFRGLSVSGSVSPPLAPLSIDLDLADGQIFTQGDDLIIRAYVTRGTEEVSGANVELKLVSPKGNNYVQQALDTDAGGFADWRNWFTVDAAVGNWGIVAEASFDNEIAEITRTIELNAVDVTDEQVQANLTEITREWMLSSAQPDGIDESFIKSIWWPKGMKVNLYEHTDKRFSPYTCSSQAFKTLQFLNALRFSPNKNQRLLMAGVDYGPISDGTSLIHVAVGLYPHDDSWLSGYVLEPWFNQKKEPWNAHAWSLAFGGHPDTDWWLANPYAGEYPTSGSDGGYYPFDKPPVLQNVNKTRVLTYSPVFVIVTDDQGRRVGRLPDGSVVNEIQESEQSNANNDDGTFVSMISVPEGKYQVSITGIGDGTFHLVTGTDNDIVNYGEQPIQSGEQAIFTLKSSDLNQPLELADKSTVTPLPGFPVDDGVTLGLDAPTLSISTSVLDVSLSWSTVSGATGYKFYYAPSPYTGEHTIGSFDIGDDTSFSVTLWDGASYYVAIKASDGSNESGYSNIEVFTIIADQASDSLCSDTCLYAGDGVCDDGGDGAEYSVCTLGSDCSDCGDRVERRGTSLSK